MADSHERDLEEVERALSVLGGRHPEQVRAERLAAEAAAKRRAQHEAEAAAQARAAWKRRVLAVVAFACVSAVGFFAWRALAARRAHEQAIAPLVARYTALGFDELPSALTAPQDRVSVSTIAGDCYAFVASDGAQVYVESPSARADAQSEAVMCTCSSGTVTARANGVVRALHIAGSAFGGTIGFAFARQGKDVHPVLAMDGACNDDMVAAFARGKRYPKQAADGAWLAAHPALAAAGFTTFATAPPSSPAVFVESPAARCYVASSGNDLSLWMLGSSIEKPIEHVRGPIAWCTAKEATFIVERTGVPSSIAVVSAPSARVGGVLGLREIARAADLHVEPWTRADERGALAMDTLRASVVPDPVATACETIDPARAKDARVLLFVGAPLTTNDLDFRCAPALGAPEALCVEARSLAWHAPPPKSDADPSPCAVAYGALPYWMSALGESRDASQELLDAELALVAFARKLTARGFFPGVIEGVTEKSDSVEILGRSGDDAIVAVGLWPAPPFVHPYTDGASWTLDGEPRVIPVRGGERVTLSVPRGSVVPIDKRRTVVFRRTHG